MNAARSDAPPRQDPARSQAAAPVALYVHVPFCISHCPYCDFVVVAGREARGPASRIPDFLVAVRREMELRADVLDARFGPPGRTDSDARPPLRSVYLGGGTPSLLPAEEIAGLVGLARRRFGLARDAEITLEVNPGPDERGDAGAQRDAGVTRVSIGAQSFDPTELGRLGRRHSPSDVADAIEDARGAGIASVNIDLLYDVPGQSLDGWLATLEAALALEPDHLSLYALTLDDPEREGLTGPAGDHLPLRPGARRWRDRAGAEQDEDRAAAQYEAADARLAAAGLRWYEISNWARPGAESRHNLAYWRGEPYEAVGPGAHAFDGVTRRWNAARLDGYLAALRPVDGEVPRLPPGGIDVRGGGPRERALLRLRTAAGLEPAAASDPDLAEALAWGRASGLLEAATDRGGVRLTLRGRLLADELFARLV